LVQSADATAEAFAPSKLIRKVFKLPGSIWEHNKFFSPGRQSNSAVNAVQRCGRLCKTARPDVAGLSSLRNSILLGNPSFLGKSILSRAVQFAAAGLELRNAFCVYHSAAAAVVAIFADVCVALGGVLAAGAQG
jgi:hypothetical protein